jgi:hypothetical protein
MRYLFFDCEYATSKGGVCKLCEFGYVVTNENFDVVNRGNLIINPAIERSEWDWRVVRTILTRKIYEYERQPSFYSYYDDIKNLIESADLIFGHSLNQDAKAVNDDSRRYGLPSIDYDFYDVKEIYREYSGIKKDIGVVKMMEELNVKGEENEHDAETDAYNTMVEFKAILDKLEATVGEIIELCPKAKDWTADYKVKSLEEAKERHEQELIDSINGKGSNDILRHGNNRKRFLQFLDNVKPQRDGTKLKDKKVSISINYEEHHYKQMLNLIQLITNEGATVVLKGSESDIFVKYDVLNEDGTIRKDSKYNYVLEANQNGSNIQIVEFPEFLGMLEITEAELDDLPIPSFDFLNDENAIIKDKRDKARLQAKNRKNKETKSNIVYTSGDTKGATLGDLFPDIFKMFDDDKNED